MPALTRLYLVSVFSKWVPRGTWGHYSSAASTQSIQAQIDQLFHLNNQLSAREGLNAEEHAVVTRKGHHFCSASSHSSETFPSSCRFTTGVKATLSHLCAFVPPNARVDFDTQKSCNKQTLRGHRALCIWLRFTFVTLCGLMNDQPWQDNFILGNWLNLQRPAVRSDCKMRFFACFGLC